MEWKGKIAGCHQWAMKAAIRIVQQQTTEERNHAATLDSNGVGLNSFDAETVTTIVRQFEQCGWITHKQADTLRRRMPKYAGQLYGIVYGNANSSKPVKEKA